MSKKLKFGVAFKSKGIASATIPDNIKTKEDAAKYVLDNWQNVPLEIEISEESTELDETVKAELHEEDKKPRYGIEISYSWGDCEDYLYGSYYTEEDAYKDMCMLASKEAYVQNEEFEDTHTCTVYFDASEKRIDLHYDYDNTWCYYRIKELMPTRKATNIK